MINELFRPPVLKQGDKVALIAPSGPLLQTERLDFAKIFLADLGLVAVEGRSCRLRHGYLAGEDHERAADVNWAFVDDDIKGIFCIRGGYGAARILDMIDYGKIKRCPKFFSGYSDITALHAAINQRARMMTFHMPMVCGSDFHMADAYTLHHFTKFVFEAATKVDFSNPDGRIWEFLVTGYGEGQLCGGNLSVIASLMGTPYELDTREKILFLEDVGEEPYKIDRMLNQLRMAGKFADCAGVVFGDFGDCKPVDIVKNLRLAVPVLYNFACGHCLTAASLPMGAVAVLNSVTNSFFQKKTCII